MNMHKELYQLLVDEVDQMNGRQINSLLFFVCGELFDCKIDKGDLPQSVQSSFYKLIDSAKKVPPAMKG